MRRYRQRERSDRDDTIWLLYSFRFVDFSIDTKDDAKTEEEKSKHKEIYSIWSVTFSFIVSL